MNAHVTHDRLQELADGAADASVELHLSECTACQAELESIRGLKAALGALPREDRVDYSLFPAIKPRISPRRNYWKAAAVALAAGLAVAVIYPQLSSAPQPTKESLRGSIRGATSHYQNALDEMIDELNARKDTLDPQTVAIVEQNLKVIDEAILASEKALAADPDNSDAAEMVASAYESKLGLLRLVERTGR